MAAPTLVATSPSRLGWFLSLQFLQANPLRSPLARANPTSASLVSLRDNILANDTVDPCALGGHPVARYFEPIPRCRDDVSLRAASFPADHLGCTGCIGHQNP